MDMLVERATAAIQAATAARDPGDYAELEAIADEAARTPAANAKEALLLACVLAGEVDRDGPHDRMEKLAESLVDFIERTAGINRRELGFDFYTGLTNSAAATTRGLTSPPIAAPAHP